MPFFDLSPAAAADASVGEYYLHPRYRTRRPIEALLLKTSAAADNFVTEQYADQISASLAQWSSRLLQSPQDSLPVAELLSDAFSGAPLRPAESHIMRSGPPIEIRGIRSGRRRRSRANPFSPKYVR